MSEVTEKRKKRARVKALARPFKDKQIKSPPVNKGGEPDPRERKTLGALGK